MEHRVSDVVQEVSDPIDVDNEVSTAVKGSGQLTSDRIGEIPSYRVKLEESI